MSASVDLSQQKECVLYRIVQYQCTNSQTVLCEPIKRLFKKCPGQGAVELVPEAGIYTDIRHPRPSNDSVRKDEPLLPAGTVVIEAGSSGSSRHQPNR